MNPARKAIVKKELLRRPTQEGLRKLLIAKLKTHKPVFKAQRTGGSVRIDMDGTTVGYIDVAPASENVGIAFKSKRQWGGKALTMVFAKDDQLERKRVAYVCAFLMCVFDDRPSEERKRLDPRADPKSWYDGFSHGHKGEISESHAVYSEMKDACRTLIDVFGDVAEAVKSARREDVKEALDRVNKDLPFLTSKLSEEEWLEMYRKVVVDQVHAL